MAAAEGAPTRGEAAAAASAGRLWEYLWGLFSSHEDLENRTNGGWDYRMNLPCRYVGLWARDTQQIPLRSLKEDLCIDAGGLRQALAQRAIFDRRYAGSLEFHPQRRNVDATK